MRQSTFKRANAVTPGHGEDRVADGGRAGARYLLYSHDGVGLGHTCRNLAIARAITVEDPSATVLLATGSDDALQLGLSDRVEVLKLPSLRKVANECYASRRLLVSPADIHRIRSGLLAGSVAGFQPDVMLVDKHPLGAGGELREALAIHRHQGGAAVLGLRDILDDPATVRAEWGEHQLGRCIADNYDRLLIYGQRGVFDPVSEYGLPVELEARSLFCGYVAREASRSTGPAVSASVEGRRPVVMATAGGGEDGTTVVSVFLEASMGAPWNAVAVTGPQAPEGMQARLEGLASRAGAALHRFLPDLCQWLSGVDVLVCMGGYNTLAEALNLGLPVVCIPRVHPRREQLLRAEAFQRLGLLECLRPEFLAPATLREAIRRALGRSRTDMARRFSANLHLNGAAQAAAVLGGLACECRERRVATGSSWVSDLETQPSTWVQA
jgi:predicted glycosyltransferase